MAEAVPSSATTSSMGVTLRPFPGLTPKCLPPLVKIFLPRRKLSQSSISPSHFTHAKAAKEKIQVEARRP
ncbi:hypothetical protein SCA6_003577 [Theobroma cacao]